MDLKALWGAYTMTEIITEQPNPDLSSQAVGRRETKRHSWSWLGLRTCCILYKEEKWGIRRHWSQAPWGMQWLSSCYSASRARSLFVVMFCTITQRVWWHFCILNQSNNQNLRLYAYHLCIKSLLSHLFTYPPPQESLMPSFLFSHIPVIYSSQDALLSHLII